MGVRLVLLAKISICFQKSNFLGDFSSAPVCYLEESIDSQGQFRHREWEKPGVGISLPLKKGTKCTTAHPKGEMLYLM